MNRTQVKKSNSTFSNQQNEAYGCCQESELPIHKPRRDATITTAPPKVYQNATCACKSDGAIAPVPTMAQVDSRGLNATYTNLNDTRTVAQNRTFQRPQQSRRDGTFTQSRRDGTFTQSRRDGTFSRPIGFERFQSTPKRSPQIGFEQFNNRTVPRSPAPIGFEQYSTSRPMNVTYPGNATYTAGPASTGFGSYYSEDYTDVGPWRNVEIPKNLRKVNIAPGANKSFPRRRVPLPSRNYSTYNDPQPIVNVREVAEHRKKAPRFYSTPGSSPFANQGMSLSSVWGQETGRSDPDASYGWSKGVRMDSFNVRKAYTPSPRNIKVTPRGYASQMERPRAPAKIPSAHKTYDYLPDPYPAVKCPYNILSLFEKTPRQVGPSTSFQPQQTMTRGASPSGTNESCGSAKWKNQTYAANRTQGRNVTTCGETPKDEKEKDFCTVLEIRTACADKPSCAPEKPLQLSIHVSCTDPSTVITPDKRFNVYAKPVEQEEEPQKEDEDLPPDCECK